MLLKTEGLNKMRCFKAFLLTAFMAALIPGCGEGQPNSPANPADMEADFGAKTAAMMKNANTGMTPVKPKRVSANLRR